MDFASASLPTGWDRKPIDQVYTFTRKPRGLKVPGSVPFLTMDHIPVHGLRVDTYEERPAAEATNGTYVENGDLLVAKITPSFENGKQAILAWDKPFGMATTEVLALSSTPGVSCKEYLFHLLLIEDLRDALARRMEGSTGRQRLPKSVLGEFVVPLPPFAEQQAIAAILGAAHRNVEQLSDVLEGAERLKNALLEHLFSTGYRGEPLHLTEVGEVPASWEVRPLGKLVRTSSGGTPSRKRPDFWRDGTVPWVKTSEVAYQEITQTEERITEAGLAGSSAKLFPAGTLIMAMYGQGVTRGRVAMLGIEAATNQACLAMIPIADVTSAFLYYLLQARYDDLRDYGHGANQRNLSAEIVKSIKVAIPTDEDERDTMVAVLEASDRKISALRDQLSSARSLLQSLRHDLITGSVRVDSSLVESLPSVTGGAT